MRPAARRNALLRNPHSRDEDQARRRRAPLHKGVACVQGFGHAGHSQVPPRSVVRPRPPSHCTSPIADRDHGAECAGKGRQFGDHRFLVCCLHRSERRRDNDRAYDRKRRRQAHLKTDFVRQGADLPRREKIEIRRARFPRITELAKMHIRGVHPFRQREQREAVGRANRARGIRAQIRARAQQRILPTDPQLASADLTVGNAAKIGAEQTTNSPEYFFHGVEPDASDQMNAIDTLANIHV
jgi:hypothetical protein